MSPTIKQFGIAAGIVAVVLCTSLLLAKMPRNVPNPVPSDTAATKPITNSSCGLAFQIPSAWSSSGILGESKIISPDDEEANADYDKSHQQQIAQAEGNWTGLDQRSLYISCPYTPTTYVQSLASDASDAELAKKQTLAEAFGSRAFHAKDSNLALIKTMTVAGMQAYEYSDTNKVPNGPSTTIYRIAMENNGKVYEIELGSVEYDQQSEAVKRIIGSMSLVE